MKGTERICARLCSSWPTLLGWLPTAVSKRALRPSPLRSVPAPSPLRSLPVVSVELQRAQLLQIQVTLLTFWQWFAQQQR